MDIRELIRAVEASDMEREVKAELIEALKQLICRT